MGKNFVNVPREFTDIPVGRLWEKAKLAKELKDLVSSAEDKAWCDGLYNAVTLLFEELMNKAKIHTSTDELTGITIGNQVMIDLYKNFQMEDTLRQIGDEIQQERGHS